MLNRDPSLLHVTDFTAKQHEMRHESRSINDE